jgi:hypothetical protein
MEITMHHGFLLIMLVVAVPFAENHGQPGVAWPAQALPRSFLLTPERVPTGATAEAARLVREAHAARAVWREFPGFVADVEMNLEGRIGQGRVIVLADGQVYVESLPDNHRAEATCHLACLVHRQLDKPYGSGASWVFLGGARPGSSAGIVRRTDDPFGFCYRIRNRQIVAVEHRSNGRKLTLHTLEWCLNPEKKHLPAVVAVHAWNTHTQELENTATYLLTWKRVGGFDLPATVRVHSAGANDRESPFVELKLTNHRLGGPAMQTAANE